MHIQNNRWPLRGPLAVALATGLVMGGQASAQDPQEPQAGATLFPATELDRIVVTARKREESILEVPMNISVIGATELNDRNISSVQEIYRTIAGGSSPTSQLVLRGLVGGNTATPGTTSQFVDGIPFNFGNVFDIEQVEVLRGPQGTLWGSNAIGGTVQIHTRQPQFNDFEVFTTVVGEQEKNLSGTRTRTQAGMNIPLVDDTLAMRMVASISHTPGKIVNAATGNARKAESEFLRTQLRWQPTADMNVRFGHVWSATDTRGSLSADRSIAGYYWEPTLARNPASPWGYDVDFDTVDCPPGAERPACLAPSPLVRSNPKFTIYDTIDGWSRDTVNLFSLSLDHDNLFGFASAHYVGSYRKNFSNSLDDWTRLDMDDMARTWIINHDRNYRTTHELRFQNLERQGGLDWTLGFFQNREWTGYDPDRQWQYHDTDARSIAIVSAWNDWAWPLWDHFGINNVAELGQMLYGNPGINYNLTTLHDYDRERAAFGELGYLLETGVGQFELTAGLRRFSFEDSTAFQRSGIWFGANGDSPYFEEGYSGKESGSRRKFSVSYMPHPEMNIYALYSEGYRPGGTNAPLPNACAEDEFAAAYQARYTSDQIDNYELGFKAALADQRLRVSSAIYHIDWSDTWASVYMPTCGFSYTTNTAGQSARSRGLEFESTFNLTDATALTFNYGYTDSVLTEDNPAIQASAGDDMTMVPRYNAYLALDRRFNVFGREAYGRVDVAAYGEFKSHFNTRPEDVSPAYRTVNLSGRMHLNDHAVVSVFINNLFNEEYLTYRSARSRTSSRTALTERYGAERSVAVRFDYSFW